MLFHDDDHSLPHSWVVSMSSCMVGSIQGVGRTKNSGLRAFRHGVIECVDGDVHISSIFP
jgi:hypothetical protein